MGHFISDEVDRIDLGDGEWIDIKQRMSYGDQQKLIASYMRLQTQLKGASPDIAMDVETGNITLLLINIKAWNLADKEGKIAPINETMIRQLDPQIANKILDEINKRNSPPKA